MLGCLVMLRSTALSRTLGAVPTLDGRGLHSPDLWLVRFDVSSRWLLGLEVHLLYVLVRMSLGASSVT